MFVCLFVFFWFVLCGIVKSPMQWFLLYSFVFVKVGEHQTVLITEDAKDQAHFVGHNKYYDQVSVTHYLVSRVGQLSYWSNGSFPYLKDFPLMACNSSILCQSCRGNSSSLLLVSSSALLGCRFFVTGGCLRG